MDNFRGFEPEVRGTEARIVKSVSCCCVSGRLGNAVHGLRACQQLLLAVYVMGGVLPVVLFLT